MSGRATRPERSGSPARSFWRHADHLRKLIGWPWLIAGAAACLLPLARALAGRGADGLRLVAFLLVAVLLRAALASTLGLNLQRHFVPLVPLLLVIVAGEATWLTSLLPWRVLRVSAQAAVALLLVVPGLWTIWPFLIPPAQPPGPPTRTGEVEAPTGEPGAPRRGRRS